MRHGIWATLGCDPTTDRSAIRKAYAARLKAMDVDADPDAFEALRDARDAALARAADPVAAAVEPVLTDDPPAEPVEVEADPEIDPLAEAMNAHFHALEALLFPGHDAPPTAEELAGIDHHGRALLADPRLEQVDFATGAERWFAETLAASLPRSDPLLEPAAAVFGWIDRRDDYALSAEAHTIVERIGATRFAALVGNPKHRLHRAWVALQTGAKPPLWGATRGDRRELLTIIRTRHPDVEGWLHPERVAEADDTTKPFAGVSIWLIIAAIVLIARAVHSAGDAPAIDPPVQYAPAPPRIAAPPVPIQGPRPEQIEFRNRFVSGLTNAPGALLRDIAEWELQVMRYYRPFDPAQCVDTGLWRPDAKLSSAWDARRDALIGQIADHARDAKPPVPSSAFRLKDGIVEAVMKITGFNHARFEASLTKDAPIADQCATQIAIRQAALDAKPAIGNTLLRALQLAAFGD